MGVELNIGICDDDRTVHRIMAGHIREYKETYQISCKVHSFYSGEELLEYKEKLDLLFLDIMMPEMDGIDTARRLEDNQVFKIIILAGSADRVREIFEIGAFSFLLKPAKQEEIFKVMEAVRAELPDQKTLEVYQNRTKYEILEKDICYVMAENGHCRIFTAKGDYTNQMTLTQMKEALDPNHFFTAHKSYIVNIYKFVKIDKRYVFLETQEKVPIAVRCYSNLKRRLHEMGLEIPS